MKPANRRFLDAAPDGLDIEIVTYPEGTRTAADAAAAIGCELDQIVKSLIFAAGDGMVLALTAGGNRVDTDRLADAVEAPISRADADGVRAATGFAIGGTPPFGHTTPDGDAADIPTVIDPRLLDFDIVWAACGTPDSVFSIRPEQLVAASGGRVVDVTVD